MTAETLTHPRTAPAVPVADAGARLRSIDVIRGAVMLLMAIDHVRVYAGVPAGGPDPAVFFTRWVTHFCAPAFVFLAGTSAYLYGRRHTDLPRFLATRGAWLVLLELTVIRVAWTFNLDFAHYNLAGVIWMIGWCMILMAGLVRLPAAAVGAIGVAVIAGHDALGALGVGAGLDGSTPGGALWQIVYGGNALPSWDAPVFFVLYTIVPWIGVMAAGYAFGRIATMDASRRDRLCLAIGLGAVAAFVGLRWLDLYGDPRPWRDMTDRAPLLAFLSTTKYPASLLFLLMTLGPTIALVPVLERTRGWLAERVAVFGRVPFFFYLLHIPIIHVLALLVSWLRTGAVDPWLFGNHPYAPGPAPDGYMWPLWLLYLIWVVAIGWLWLPCAWFAALKARRRERWLSYL